MPAQQLQQDHSVNATLHGREKVSQGEGSLGQRTPPGDNARGRRRPGGPRPCRPGPEDPEKDESTDWPDPLSGQNDLVLGWRVNDGVTNIVK